MLYESSPPRSRRRLIVPVVLAAAIAATAGVLVAKRGTSAPSVETPVAVRTAEVVRTDLSATRSLTGTLGFGAAEPLKGTRAGMVTWLPRPGAAISRGGQVFRVDDQPVQLFYGQVPLYRDLERTGTVGRDVRVVATNLKKLGYAIGTQPSPGTTVTQAPPSPAPAPGTSAPAATRVAVRKGEGVLTLALLAAIKRWQRDAHLPETGRISVGDVVVLPGPVRVESITAQRGDDAAAPLMTVTPTAKVITVSAEPSETGAIRRGDPVTVVLPGDKSVPGSVAAIGTALRTDEEPGVPKRVITVTVDEEKSLSGIDAADVRVDLPGETHRDVLAVPVGALVALSEGGYAVQAPGGGLIAVTIGMFDKGLVEVSGDGLTEGTVVVTTS
ncbi:efflux RND transporter periplasmic adaptor subunit [Actinoplanes sp. NPDC051861]|uniref:efflux RND transporter periplasmic adaptor subunit n=1 Tax=Actinoplanes sp. NPDC051861 TaxID=3155170 RepID=UPI00341E7381